MSDAAFVLERLRRQQEKYREMVAVVASQRSVFASLDVDAILALIERKRSILADVDRLEAELAPVKASWAAVRAAFSAEEARAVQEMLDATQQVLQDLVRYEDEGRSLLQQRSAAKSETLDQLMQKSRARGAYGGR
jgi:hypothetical protein